MTKLFYDPDNKRKQVTKISLQDTRFPLGHFHSKSYVVESCIYKGKDEHPCIVTIQMVTMNILTLLPYK